MTKTISYKGQLPIGEQEKIHLSTNNGLTGYKIKKFKILTSTPGVGTNELVGKIYLTDQTGNITSTVDFSQTDLIATSFSHVGESTGTTVSNSFSETIIIDAETFNQDIFVYIADAHGGTVPANFYIELEKFAIDINTSTYHTLKNIRSRKQ